MAAKQKTIATPEAETRGRPLSKITLDLLKGKQVKVPWGTSFPDKTIKAYGYRMRSRRNPNGQGYILWIEDI